MKAVMVLLWWLLWRECIVGAQEASTSSGVPFGVQTAGSGNSFASTLRLDPENQDWLYVTGATYSNFWSAGGVSQRSRESMCFFGIFHLSTQKWIHTHRFGMSNSNQACHTMIPTTKPLSDNSRRLFLGGQTEENGDLTHLRARGSTKSTQYGIVLDVLLQDENRQTGSTNDAFSSNSAGIIKPHSFKVGGRLLHASPLQSVHAMALDASQENLFVASWQSDDDSAEFSSQFDIVAQQPNLIEAPKFGKHYFVSLFKFPITTLTNADITTATASRSTDTPELVARQTLNPHLWNREISTDLQNVQVADLLYIKNDSIDQGELLVLVGTAQGKSSQAFPAPNIVGDDLDGFVTILDTNSALIDFGTRIISQRNKIDRIEGACLDPSPSEGGPYFYIVGSSNAAWSLTEYEENQLTSIILKLDLKLNIQWVMQLDAKDGPLATNPDGPQITGKSCTVTPDGQHVYVGGIVEDGSIINQSGHQSFGKNDVWVGQLSTGTKNSRPTNFNWIRQMGTSSNETLVDMTADKDGNVIVVGNTDGSFMRRKSKDDIQSDVFIISLARKDGNYPAPAEDNFGVSGASTSEQTTQPPTTATIATGTTTAIATIATTSTPQVSSTSTNPSGSTPSASSEPSQRSRNGPRAGTIAVVLVLSVLCFSAACYFFHRSRRLKEAEYSFPGANNANNSRPIDPAKVTSHLKSFENQNVEVDLKRSATGGFHGTYINGDGGPRYFSGGQLDQRNGLYDDEEQIIFDSLAGSGGSGGSNETAPLTSASNSSVVRDSLFTDDDDDDDDPFSYTKNTEYSTGQHHHPYPHRNSNYDGLVDAYNTTWDDLSPHTLPTRRLTMEGPSRTNSKLMDVDISDNNDSLDSGNHGNNNNKKSSHIGDVANRMGRQIV